MVEQDLPTIDPVLPVVAFDGQASAITGAAADVASLADALAAIPDDAFTRTLVAGVPDAWDGRSHPLALDVLETADRFEIHASVPGIDPAALDIMVLGESVRIAGSGGTVETPLGSAEVGCRWLLRERPVGRFDRTVSLPSLVSPDAASATVHDGLLIVTLPKARRVGSMSVPVRSLPAPVAVEHSSIDCDS